MKKQLVGLGAAAALLLGAAAPASAAFGAAFTSWNWCTSNSLSICMGFNLQQDGTNTQLYQLTATYLNTSVGTDGIMTAVGLYRLPTDPDVNISNVSVISPGSWQLGANQLSGGGQTVFEVATNSQNGVVDGVAMGGSVVIQFNSTSGNAALAALYARSHIQSLGVNDCSIKPDSRLTDGVVGGAAAADLACGTSGGGGGGGGGTGSTVPEPISMVLLGSG